MARLPLTTNQKNLVLDPVSTDLETAFASGVDAPAATPFLDPMKFYAEKMKEADRTVTKDTFRLVLAALIRVLGIDQPGLGTGVTPVTVVLKGPLSDGYLTVVGGLIIDKQDPT